MSNNSKIRGAAQVPPPLASNQSPFADLSMDADIAAEAVAEVERLRGVLRPFVEAYRRGAHPIPDSDLDNEQPRSVSVTLGDCRRAARVLR